MKQGNERQRQQGDVFLERVENLPTGAKKMNLKKQLVLAHGESGNVHTLEVSPLIEAYEHEGKTYVRVLEKPAEVQHTGPSADHAPQVLHPGLYEFGKIAEMDYFQELIRPVCD